jgi:hypothetical protein
MSDEMADRMVDDFERRCVASMEEIKSALRAYSESMQAERQWTDRKERIRRMLIAVMRRDRKRIARCKILAQSEVEMLSMDTTAACDAWGIDLPSSTCSSLVIHTSTRKTRDRCLSKLVAGLEAAPNVDSLDVCGFHDDECVRLIRARPNLRRLRVWNDDGEFVVKTAYSLKGLETLELFSSAPMTPRDVWRLHRAIRDSSLKRFVFEPNSRDRNAVLALEGALRHSAIREIVVNFELGIEHQPTMKALALLLSQAPIWQDVRVTTRYPSLFVEQWRDDRAVRSRRHYEEMVDGIAVRWALAKEIVMKITSYVV